MSKKDIEIEEVVEEIEEIGNGIFDNIDFNIENCTTQETITKKLLYLNDEEKNILAEFKDQDAILSEVVYDELHNSITDVFDNYRSILNQRLQIIMKTQHLQAETELLEFEFEKVKVKEIDNRYKKRLLKYQNRLYSKMQQAHHRINKKKEKELSKAKLTALRQPKTEQKLPP